jgi:hypothetical protein
MSDLQLFLPLTKVDADQRIVYGLATAEVEDRAGEICDYATTKPYYEAWSAEMNAASGGKSLGSLRAMHGRVAAGKITDIAFDDEGKRIMIAAKIVDDEEWRKVEEGIYTGFSQGGRYVKRWPDPGSDLTRYTAEPHEISLVDMPSVAAATFEVIKNGIAEKRAFATRTANKDVEPPDAADDDSAAQRLAALVQLVSTARALSEQLAAEAQALAEQIGAQDAAPDADTPNGDADDNLTASKIAAPPASPAAAEPIPSPGLAKALGETAALRTRLDAIAPDLATLSSRVAALEAQPLPAKAALRAVSKSADGVSRESASPVEDAIRSLAALSPGERAHALTKLSLANPVSPRF